MQGPLGAPPAEEKLDQAVDDEADPGKDENAPVKAEGFVAPRGGRWGMRTKKWRRQPRRTAANCFRKRKSM